MKPYRYVLLSDNNGESGTTMRLKGNVYYRDNGHWSVGYRIKNGRIFAKTICNMTEHLEGIEFFQITKEEWAKENIGFNDYGVIDG